MFQPHHVHVMWFASQAGDLHKKEEESRRFDFGIYNDNSSLPESELPQNTLPFTGTIWADIGYRQLFVYVVDSFISRGTVVGVSNMTGAKEETITKYFRIIKNALHEEVETSLDSFQIGGVGMTVHADESHVFKRKNNIGRLLVFTEHGWLWLFGTVEDTPNGKLFLTMVKQRDKETLLGIIKKHVCRGMTIFMDSWRGYLGLSAYGFLHFRASHKKNFVSHHRVEVDCDRVGDCLVEIF